MFDVCEWNDHSEAQSLTQCLERSSGEAAAKKSALSRRKRTKRNRELLEILHSLKTPGIWQQDPHAAEIQTLTEHVTGKKSPDCIPPCEAPQPVKPALPSEPRLSRRQWKNKVKNQKRHKNKFKSSSSSCARGGVERTGEGGEKPVTNEQGGSVPTYDLAEHKPKKINKGSKAGRPERDEEEERVAAKRARPEPMTVGSAHVSPANKSGALLQRRTVQKLKRILQKAGQGSGIGTNEEEEEPEVPAGEETVGESPPSDRSTSLRSRMEERLSSARFRYINQQLYTSDSRQALQLFQNDPEAFTVYHKGFSQQVQHWPVNPVTQIIKYIKNRPPSLVLADFGCGDALIARSVRNTVHSFDLVALNDHVTACDMCKVPLSDESVDIAVFCLSLMGKNVSEFLSEANRVLIPGGALLLAEVSSRFDDVRQFLSAMSQLGFKNTAKNTDNSHFFLFEFSKSGPPKERVAHPGLELRPCLYKKR